MKCPKCGFNSFEFLDNCKKCGNDLIAFKESHGIRPIVLTPLEKFIQAPAQLSTMNADKLEESALAGVATDESFIFEPPVTAESASIEEALPTFDLGFAKEEKGAAEPFSFAGEQPTGLFGEFSFEEVSSEQMQQSAAEEQSVAESFADLLETSPAGVSGLEAGNGGFSVGEFEDFAETVPASGTGNQERFNAIGEEFEMDDIFANEENPALVKIDKSAPAVDKGPSSDEFDFLFGSDDNGKENPAQ